VKFVRFQLLPATSTQVREHCFWLPGSSFKTEPLERAGRNWFDSAVTHDFQPDDSIHSLSTGSWKLEAGNRQLATGSWELDIVHLISA
jgi:hypothetical protein